MDARLSLVDGSGRHALADAFARTRERQGRTAGGDNAPADRRAGHHRWVGALARGRSAEESVALGGMALAVVLCADRAPAALVPGNVSLEEASGELMSITKMTTHIVAACARRPWLVILVAGALAASAFTYNLGHIAIDTDSAKLIGEDLAWRKRERVFDAAFPQRADLIAVVVDGATPELAEEATTTLAKRLSSQPGMYRAVWRPDGGPFFERAGLLFESTAEVSRTTQQLIAAQPLLGTLAVDPTLRGLMGALSLMLEGVEHDAARDEGMPNPGKSRAHAMEAVVAGQIPAFSWHPLFTGSVPAPRELRRFIL